MSPYRRLVGVLGDDSLLAYDDKTLLFDKRDEIWEKIAALTRTWTTADLMEAMLAVDIYLCGEVKSHLEAAEGPAGPPHGDDHQLRAPRGRDREGGVVAPAVKMSATPAAIDRTAPLVGQHTREILSDFGYDDAEIAAFEDKASSPTAVQTGTA